MMKIQGSVLLMLAMTMLLVSACVAPIAVPSPPPAEPAAESDAVAIVLALAENLNASDLDASMTLLADDVVFQIDFYDQTLTGIEQVRDLFGELVAGNFRIEITPQAIDGGTVTTETKTYGDGIPGGGPNIATEIYVVEDGKITGITWTPTDETIAILTASMEQVEATVQAQAAALNAGDVDAAVALLASDSIFEIGGDDEPLVGVDQIRALFDELVAGHFRIEVTPRQVDEWSMTTETKTWGDGIPGGGPNLATEVYVVEDGKITSISWTPIE